MDLKWRVDLVVNVVYKSLLWVREICLWIGCDEWIEWDLFVKHFVICDGLNEKIEIDLW